MRTTGCGRTGNRLPLRLRLYIAGNAPNSVQARRNLDALLAECAPGSFELEVIDCLSEPLRTLDDGVVVTPTLVKLSPGPSCTIIGSLGNADTLRSSIGLAS